MPSAINADNGVVSGTAGLKSSADNSGVLDLQTNGTTAISISASQVVTFANQPAYTGGTANGVLYLNASKVLTSGSALVFDGSQLDIPLGSAGTPSLSTPTDPNTGMFFPAADTIAFAEGGVEAMRLDSSGNMGLGVTPSAWDSSVFKAFEIPAGSFNAYQTSQINLTQNAYYTTAPTYWAYKNTAAASLYRQTGGIHSWHNAPSGTSGAGVTFTQAMTLDASGRLALGRTSASYLFDAKVANSASNVNAFQISNDANSSIEMYIRDSISTICAGGAGNLVFATGGSVTERARIDSSGNLLVGTTSGSGNNERLNITTNTNQTARFINTNATSGNISIVSTLGANTDNTSSYHILTATNGATRFYVYGNGTSGNASDQNLKKNIETTRDGYAEDLCKLRVVKYNWNDQADGSPKELGWIAQEVEQVFPNLVQDGIPNENGETFKEVKTSVLPFMLLKALQEQQAIIESLKARLDAANL